MMACTTRSNAILRVSVACAYEGPLATGSYHSVSSDWISEGNITITADPEDPYTVFVSVLQQLRVLMKIRGLLLCISIRPLFQLLPIRQLLLQIILVMEVCHYVGYGTL